MKGDLAKAASLGVEMAIPVFLGAGIGYWLDQRWQSKPWLMVAGVVLGAAAGFWTAYKFAVNK
jgi:F0F1-type ATP synthase assembly protein I